MDKRRFGQSTVSYMLSKNRTLSIYMRHLDKVRLDLDKVRLPSFVHHTLGYGTFFQNQRPLNYLILNYSKNYLKKLLQECSHCTLNK